MVNPTLIKKILVDHDTSRPTCDIFSILHGHLVGLGGVKFKYLTLVCPPSFLLLSKSLGSHGLEMEMGSQRLSVEQGLLRGLVHESSLASI